MKKNKQKNPQLGTIMGTSARMQSLRFIPLNSQRIMQSFTYVTITISKVKVAMLIS